MKKRAVLSAIAIVSGALTLVASFSVYHQAHLEWHSPVLTRTFEQDISAKEAALEVPPDVRKSFDWRFADRRRTPYALVQIHGFSASRREISPVAETLARELGWNLFMTRLTGHGLGSAGMSKVTAQSLLDDAEEALQVGRRMGQKVVLLGTSTGAILSLALAQKHPEAVAALILVSPNFRPGPLQSLLLRGPVGALIARYLITEHSFKALSPEEEQFWTTSYSMSAVHEMMEFLSWSEELDLPMMKAPLLVFYSDTDQIVSIDLLKARFATYGGPRRLFEFKNADHVLAGAIKSPQNTAVVVETAKGFLKEATRASP